MKRAFYIWIVNNFVSIATISAMGGALAASMSPALANHRRSILFPACGWTCFGVAVVFIVAGVAAHLRLRTLETREVEGRCPKCGYDLRATPDRCPECGTTTPSYVE